MRLFKTVHDFDYSWQTVSAAQWQKYPNEHCPHVQHVDVLDSSVDPETGVLRIERLISVTQKAPAFILRAIGASTTQYVREVAIIDPKSKTLTLDSKNLTLSNILSCEESITYSEHPSYSEKTLFTQQATISAGSTVSRMASMIEDWSVKRFQQNAAIGREGFSKVLEKFVVLAEAKEGATTN
ncbi:Phospholipid metabolism protein [Umbelopsis nana]